MRFRTMRRPLRVQEAEIQRPPQTSKFFSLPSELRLDIYDIVLHDYRGIRRSTPNFHPAYPLLFVCHQMRLELGAFFYRDESKEFVFTQAKACQGFIFATKSLNRFITKLTIIILPHELESLYFTLGLTSNLKSLSIHLRSSSYGNFVHQKRPNAIYNLPRRTGLSSLGEYEIHLRNRKHRSYRFLPEYYGEKDSLHVFRPARAVSPPTTFPHLANFDEIEFHYSWSRDHDPNYFALARCLERLKYLRMPKLTCLRYLAVYGRPAGYGRVQFELGIMSLVDSMTQRAAQEGKGMVLGYGSRQKKARTRYFDTWIEGEFDVPERDLDWLFPEVDNDQASDDT